MMKTRPRSKPSLLKQELQRSGKVSPVDAPKSRVIKAFSLLGFKIVRDANTLRWCAIILTGHKLL